MKSKIWKGILEICVYFYILNVSLGKKLFASSPPQTTSDLLFFQIGKENIKKGSIWIVPANTFLPE